MYIPTDADVSAAAEILENCVSRYENRWPDSARMIMGDFNACDFQEKIPEYEQSVKCTTRGNNTLDKLYCNVRGGYRAYQRPQLGTSDHNMIFCAPTYKQVLKREPCKVVQYRKWEPGNISQLQACLECTDWTSLIDSGADVNVNTDIFNSYFNFCLDMLIPTIDMKIYPNNKPWINRELISMLNEKRRIRQSGNSDQKKELQKRIDKKITDAKKEYKEKIEGLFRTNKSKDAWKGLKTLCGYNKKQITPEPDDVATYVNDVNTFFARFEQYDFGVEQSEVLGVIRNKRDEQIEITNEAVMRELKRVRVNKATGPDGVPARAIKCCAEQLTPVLTQLFQDSIIQGEVPRIWKLTEIKPIAKTPFPKNFNDYRPVALTSNIMKCLENIVRNLLCDRMEDFRDQMQFAYCINRSVQDATLTFINDISKHLDQKNSSTRILFIDFSSAFNTIQPHTLLKKLLDMGYNSNLLRWIFSFLTNRPQYTKIGTTVSTKIATNTGAPQGCVLSPVLFTLYTNDCRSLFDDCTMIKYADDTVIIGKILNDDCRNYETQVQKFVEWCSENYLILNVKKTKEMIIDFRRKPTNVPDAINIDGEPVERVKEYKYLGIVIDDELKGNANTNLVIKKCNQRLYFIRILNNVQVNKKIINLFYRSTLESILIFSISTWYKRLTLADKNKLNIIVKKAKKLGASVTLTDVLYQEAALKQVGKIMQDQTHPLNNCFNFLRSGRRLALPLIKTDRYRKSFVPSSIVLFNHFYSQK